MVRVIWRIIDKYIFIPLVVLIGVFHRLFRFSFKRSNNQKILIIKLSALGDTIMMIPIIRQLRKTMPDSYIYMLATIMNGKVLMNSPYLDKVEILNLNNPLIFLKQIFSLRKEKFDLVIDFEQRIRLSSLVAYFICRNERIGFKTKGYLRHYLYTKTIIHRRDWHEFKCMAELVKELIGEIKDTSLQLWIRDNDQQWAKDFLKSHNLLDKKIIVFHPGCGDRYLKGARAREWPKDNFIKLANLLIERYNNIKILFTAGKDEVKLIKEISSQLKYKAPVLIESEINRLSALLKYCSILICGDTGIMHLASASNIKTVAIFGPSDPKRWRPLNDNCIILKKELSCSPCQYFGIDRPGCSEYKCIKQITVEEVYNKIESIL